MPSRRTRPENKGLPTRWRYTFGAYRYQVPPGMEEFWDGKKTFKLGKTLHEAYAVWAERIGAIDDVKTVSDLLDRYAIEVIPTKSFKTQKENIKQAKCLKAVFGHMPILSVTPQHVYQYVDKRRKKTKDGKGGFVAAKREYALLSHAYTKAVEWGLINRHPFRGQVRFKSEKPRTRYIEDWEILECLAIEPPKGGKSAIPVIQAYMRLKLLTGLRKGDMLRLKTKNLKSDGIHVKTSKTGKGIIYEWSDELRKTIDLILDIRPVDISPYLFCTTRGKPYIDENTGNTSGWDSCWQRFMKKVMEETNIKDRFTDHDLRAKCASDAGTLEHAQKLLGHADSAITERVYRRKSEKVKPLK